MDLSGFGLRRVLRVKGTTGGSLPTSKRVRSGLCDIIPTTPFPTGVTENR